jgi:hypothetical protein
MFIHLSANCSPLAAEIKLGLERIGARTDGGLQIFLPQDKNFVAWDRSYYEIALEAKRFFKTKKLKDGSHDISEVTEDSIHAGQIFAEMLGAVCHPDFFIHADVEVPPPFETKLTIGICNLYSTYRFPIIPLQLPPNISIRIISRR